MSGAKLRKRGGGWAAIPNAFIRDETLCSDARILLMLLNSHSDGWVFRRKQLETNLRFGRTRMDRAMNELRERGHLITTQPKTPKGAVIPGPWDWIIDVKPTENPAVSILAVPRTAVRRTATAKTSTPLEDKGEEYQVKEDIDRPKVRESVGIIYACWNRMATDHGLSLVKTNVMNASRQASIVKRLQDCGGDIDELRQAISNVPNNPHWLGNNNRGWKANFDWVFKTANFSNVLEFDQPAKTPKAQHDRPHANQSRHEQKTRSLIQSAVNASTGMGANPITEIPEEWASPPSGSLEGPSG